MSLVQIMRRDGEVRRVALGQEPLIEVELRDDQQIIAFECWEVHCSDAGRKTSDWRWTAWVATRL